MHAYVSSKKNLFQATLDHLLHELSSLRTGRANPGAFEEIKVQAYDSVMELKGLASLRLADAKTIVVEPWDKTLLQAIEKGIRDADMGVSPAVDGEVIRIVMPQMTQENREKIVKIMKEKLEDACVALRHVREDIREEVLKKEKAKEMAEDEKFKILEELDILTKEFTQTVEAIGEKKEAEIMKV